MGFNSTTFLILSFFFIFLVHISAPPAPHNTGNEKNISISCNEGKIGAENEHNVKGKTYLSASVGSSGQLYNTVLSSTGGGNVSLGNISNIHVSGTNRGCIGGRNDFTVTGGLSFSYGWGLSGWFIFKSLLICRDHYSTYLSTVNCFQSLIFLVFKQDESQPSPTLATSEM